MTPRTTTSWLLSAKTAAAVFFLLTSGFAQALGPHECALIVNRNSDDSREIANYYADLRQIPAANICEIDIPSSWLAAGSSITPQEFRSVIHDEVVKMIAERKLPQILAWIYSVDFPSSISTAPPMSLTGITFVRGESPPADLVQSGKWPSPLFAGPDVADGPAAFPATLENYAIKLGTNLPLPSMMLGWSGSRGMTASEIKESLRNSFLSDGSSPQGAIFLEKSEDVRSTTRAWLFDRVKKDLAGTGIEVVIAGEPPSARQRMIGLMTGRADYDPGAFGPISGGAYADSLTSYGAVFHSAEQTKSTGWLRHGAAGTAGTITEPGSLEVPVILWPKFPTARLFAHYAAGCTMLEAFYLATRSPLQILPIGDPLCRPWGTAPLLTLVNLTSEESGPVSGKVEFMASLGGGFAGGAPDIMYLLDERPILKPQKGNPALGIQTTGLSDGYHELRGVAYSQGLVRHQGFSRLPFQVRNRGRSVSLGGYTNLQQAPIHKPFQFRVTAEDDPTEVRILGRGIELARSRYASNLVIAVDASRIGKGPVDFQAIAIYRGPEAVASPPIKLVLSDANNPPVINGLVIETNENGKAAIRIDSVDPDGDTVQHRWFYNILGVEPAGAVQPEKNTGSLILSSTNVLLSSRDAPVQLVYPLEQPHQVSAVRTAFEFTGSTPTDSRHMAGIVFNYQDESNFMSWGADGHTSAWVLRRVRDGQEETLLSRGAPIRAGRRYELAIEATAENAIVFKVNDEFIGRRELNFAPGKAGVCSGRASVAYDYLLVAPPGAVNSRFSGSGDLVLLDSPGETVSAGLTAVSSDGKSVLVRKLNP